MTEVSITVLPYEPLHVLEVWSNPSSVAKRFSSANGFALPKLGRSARNSALVAIRYEPTVWLMQGPIDSTVALLGEDGALTAIGGSVVCVRLTGSWRELLMEGGVFNATAAAFDVGCSAATIIDHVGVRLHVVAADTCDVYLPASYSDGLIHFWQRSALTLSL